MVSFVISLVALVLGYLLYGKFVAHVFGPDDRPTPAVTKADDGGSCVCIQSGYHYEWHL